jgi:hypothetical protein
MGWLCDLGPWPESQPRRTREDLLADFLRISVVIGLRPLPAGEDLGADPPRDRHRPQRPEGHPHLP